MANRKYATWLSNILFILLKGNVWYDILILRCNEQFLFLVIDIKGGYANENYVENYANA